MKPGDMVRVTCFGKGVPFYTNYSEGLTSVIPKGTVCIVVGEKLDEDMVGTSRFFHIVTPVGIGWISSEFCEVIGEAR